MDGNPRTFIFRVVLLANRINELIEVLGLFDFDPGVHAMLIAFVAKSAARVANLRRTRMNCTVLLKSVTYKVSMRF